MFLKEDINIGFRNPIHFVNQWYNTKQRRRAIFIWLLYGWIRNDCDIWIKYGIRIIGIEIEYTKYLPYKTRKDKKCIV